VIHRSDSFVAVAAQFGLLPYVREKIKQHPELLQSKRHTISILENAILGGYCFGQVGCEVEAYLRQERYLRARGDFLHFMPGRRIELIGFLVGNGANSKQVPELLVESLRGADNQEMVDGPVNYWGLVRELLGLEETFPKRIVKRLSGCCF
jgi:hypothetical protein